MTAEVLLALLDWKDVPGSAALRATGLAALLARRNPDGGFGSSPSTPHASALALEVLLAAGAGAELVDPLVAWLEREQLADGSWSASPYQTALVVSALRRSLGANLRRPGRHAGRRPEPGPGGRPGSRHGARPQHRPRGRARECRPLLRRRPGVVYRARRVCRCPPSPPGPRRRFRSSTRRATGPAAGRSTSSPMPRARCASRARTTTPRAGRSRSRACSPTSRSSRATSRSRRPCPRSAKRPSSP